MYKNVLGGQRVTRSIGGIILSDRCKVILTTVSDRSGEQTNPATRQIEYSSSIHHWLFSKQRPGVADDEA